MKPTVGRIVYYKSYGTPGGEYKSEDRAAIITNVHQGEEDVVDLCVFNPGGLFFNLRVSKGSNGGQWDWMPYQKGQAKKTEELNHELSKVGRLNGQAE
ncbi:hypothetical protein J2S74_002306 [Evansella vedderi]|uniref:Uncharacterized protein n=1 Tax=Evansella vedderi TaxID=38282 RepID=A0ABT9ZUL0_9BACI|nr:hypothetical protein [Evansella vedderi]MDQ0254924.1 hypothetical protein [Evansella vedderi]